MAKKKDKPRCGAKLRGKTGLCKAQGLANGRCRIHGGLGNQGINPETLAKRAEKSLARGLYSDMLFPWEEDIYGACGVGTLDEELKLLRIQLRRAVMAQKNYETVMETLGEWREQADTVEIPPEIFKHLELDGYEYQEKKKQNEGDEEVRKMLRRKRDYRREIQQWVKLIAALEVSRQQLMQSSLFGTDALEAMASDLRLFTERALGTVAK